MNILSDAKIKRVLYPKELTLSDRIKFLFLDNPFSKVCCHTVEELFFEYGDVHQRDLRVAASGILSSLWNSRFIYLRKLGSCPHSSRQHFMYYFKQHPDIIRKGEFYELRSK